MNKSALRNFAVWARRDLIKRISDRANLLGVYEDKPTKEIQATTEKGFVVNGVTFNYKKDIRDAFVKRVQELGYQDAIEEIAYTWFNRIIALRFMEVNGYLTNGKNGEKIYVIGSTVDGKNEPDALTNADKLSFVDKFTVYDYQDANDNNGLYRYILTKQCNDLNKAMPLMFEEIEDYAELLLPDHLLDKGAIIDHLVNDISARDFNITVKDDDGENASQVEIIGWLYQFYISEKKDEVFASKEQINKGTLPAVTQLFTPDWIVKYMTENSLGKMWVDGHKSSNLKQSMKYFVEEAEQTDDVKAKLEEINKEYASKKVTDITFIDPCCGSGHILVYAFDLFFKMYQESGYITSEIPTLILQNNLFGIDVDKRATQLTSFALTMKALSYDKDFLSKKVYPNVIDIKESNEIDQLELKDFIRIAKLNNKDEEILFDLIEKFKDAELYGSLIKDFNYSTEQYEILSKVIEQVEDVQFNLVDALAVHNVKPNLLCLIKQAIILSSQYDIVATNPPYMPTSSNDKISQFAKTFYPDSKIDMYAMFMETNLVKNNGYLAMINMQSWMFLSSYEKLRNKILNNKDILSMVHLGPRAFEEISGDVVQTTAFVLRNKTGKIGTFINLTNVNSANEKEKQYNNKELWFVTDLKKISNIPSKPLNYWLTEKKAINFEKTLMKDNLTGRTGLICGKNEKFIRYWWEPKSANECFDCNDFEQTKLKKEKWFPYNHGGNRVKWYGNHLEVVDFGNGAANIKNEPNSMLRNVNSYFHKGLTWNRVGSGMKFATRIAKEGFVFDDVNPLGEVNENNILYTLAFMNTIVFNDYLRMFCTAMKVEIGHIANVPFIFQNNRKIENFTKENIEIAKQTWDTNETSWDFEKNPLI